MSLIPILPRQPDIRQQFPISRHPVFINLSRLYRLRDGTAGFAVMQAGLEATLPDVRLKFRVQFLQFFRLHALLCFQQAEARRIQHADAVMNQQLRIARRVLAALDFLADFTRLQLQVKQRVQQRRFAHAALPRQTAAVRPAHQRPNAIQPFLVPRADTQHRAVRPAILLLHLVLGTPGSGKSFSVKREILDTFLKTTDDIIICDPEAEYYPLVQALDGQLIKISTSSQQHINPMDIVWDNEEDDENPIAVKSDFLISLMELIVGGKYGLTAEERSIVDQCVRNIYNHFLSHNPSKETMPILEDLLKELRENGGDIAKRVANSLEMYVTGSQNVFNHRTTVDLNNRIICFDIKQLGNQLRKVGMLIVQDQVWNRVSLNRGNKSTRYYIDEFHLLLKEEQTAKYSVEMWKRFRKWGGIPTGITQNIKDLLQSQEIENIFDNSDFIYMLNQAAGDRDILAEKLHISDQQLKYVTNAGRGQGLIFFGDTILPFVDRFPRDTKMYQLMTTDPADLANKVS